MANVEVSSGPDEFRACTALHENRDMHAACSTDLFAIAPIDYFSILTDATVTWSLLFIVSIVA